MLSRKKVSPYALLSLLAGLTIGLGTVVYHFVENWTWLDAYYFSVITLTTVGYGDFSPETALGKLFTTGYILTGVGIITTFISLSLKRRQDRIKSRHEVDKHEGSK